MSDQWITAIAADGSRYPIDKLEAHRRDVPHLAVSVFVSCGDRLLLQQRAVGKYHSGGLWTNTCCTHPAWAGSAAESAARCARRRLAEELGIDLPLSPIGSVRYRAPVPSRSTTALYENELVYCFHGEMAAPTAPSAIDAAEVMAVEWRRFAEIVEAVETEPERYSAWFRIYLRDHRSMLDGLFGTRG